MGELFERIRTAVQDGRFVIGDHADERLRERRMPAWQVIAGIHDGRLLAERPRTRPNPTVELQQTLADGTDFKAVWAWLRYNAKAKLVTVHFFDDDQR